ncbi:hypothetical protein CEXT_601101 [Caerostris extrusa]|uniref:Uncharacterized protein n=1 Tax=Caerostris extrusa TaxID=172846 RepID=A0AAV4QRY8_CAEEX|nr:hypothetical protein CEXT_601101 [Caerostris extrusa]
MPGDPSERMHTSEAANKDGRRKKGSDLELQRFNSHALPGGNGRRLERGKDNTHADSVVRFSTFVGEGDGFGVVNRPNGCSLIWLCLPTA